jgi:hypothetical protein
MRSGGTTPPPRALGGGVYMIVARRSQSPQTVTRGEHIVEYDNRQNDANHIHSVWREVENDFAGDVLREHLLMYHVI